MRFQERRCWRRRRLGRHCTAAACDDSVVQRHILNVIQYERPPVLLVCVVDSDLQGMWTRRQVARYEHIESIHRFQRVRRQPWCHGLRRYAIEREDRLRDLNALLCLRLYHGDVYFDGSAYDAISLSVWLSLYSNTAVDDIPLKLSLAVAFV